MQIKFVLTVGEFNLELITSRFDFLEFKVSLFAIIQSLTFLVQYFSFI